MNTLWFQRKKRFGLDDDHQSANPDIVSPRKYIQKELNDLMVVTDLLVEVYVLLQAKKEKLAKMMAYAREKGML